MRRRLLGLGLVSLVGLAGYNFSRVNANSTDARVAKHLAHPVAHHPGEASLTNPVVAPMQREQADPTVKNQETQVQKNQVQETQGQETQAQKTQVQAREPQERETQRTGEATAKSVPAAPASSTAPGVPNPSSPDATNAASEAGTLHQDYGPATPLPATGQVTIRSDIRNLDPNQLIAPCPSDSSPYAFAESTNYRVQICSAEYDPWQPKYYIGQAKQGNEELKITSTDPAAARQLIFNHAGYTYVLYRDGRTRTASGAANAYLQIFTPSGEGYAEALLYFYETSPLRMPQ